MDDAYEAVKRYVTLLQPFEQDIATVTAVDTATALISTRNGSPISAIIGDVSQVAKGDTVIISRPKGIQSWTITSVLLAKQRGLSAQASAKSNKAPGGKEWASVMVNANSYAKTMSTGGTVVPLTKVTKMFVGGTALITFMCYCNITTNGGTFNVQLVVDQTPLTAYILQQATGVTLPIQFTYMHPTPLVGTHDFQVQVYSASSAGSFTLTHFAVAEI